MDIADLAVDETVEAFEDAHHAISLGDGQTSEATDGSVHATRWCAHIHHAYAELSLRPTKGKAKNEFYSF